MASLRSVVTGQHLCPKVGLVIHKMYRKTLIIHFLDASRHINQGEIFDQSTNFTVPNKQSSIHIFSLNFSTAV